jgi:beta-fructofuranosidase
LVVSRSADGREQTKIVYDPAAKTLTIDFARASLNPKATYAVYFSSYPKKAGTTRQVAPLELAPGEPLKLRVYLDRSILEVFANDRQCVTQRIYPTLPDAKGLALFTEGEAMTIPEVRVFDISPTNPW